MGMSRLQVQEYVAEIKRRIVARGPAKEDASLFSAKSLSAPEAKLEKANFLDPIEQSVNDFKPAASHAVMRFLASCPELLTKLERLAEVDNKRSLKESLLDLLEKAVTDSLDKRDPKKMLERREAKQKAKVSKEARTVAARAAEAKQKAVCKKRTRYIPSKVREAVFAKANYQCEFVGAEGQRCSQRTGLQVDHIQPFSNNGSNRPENLRCLCAPHNLHEAKKQFGEKFMQSKIKQQKISGSEVPNQLKQAYATRLLHGNGIMILQHG